MLRHRTFLAHHHLRHLPLSASFPHSCTSDIATSLTPEHQHLRGLLRLPPNHAVKDMAPKKRKASEAHKPDGRGVKKAKQPLIAEKPRTTRSMTVVAGHRAAQPVLDTTELLEAILVCLPAKKLFTIQRVCRRFRDVITSSVKLQGPRFVPVSTEEGRTVVLEYQPSAYETAPCWYDPEPNVKVSDDVTEAGWARHRPAAICHLLSPEAWNKHRRPFEPAQMVFEMASFVKRPGSWRTVPIADSPIRQAWLRVRVVLLAEKTREILMFTFEPDTLLRSTKGLSLGDVENAVMNKRQYIHSEHGRLFKGRRTTTVRKMLSDANRLYDDETVSLNRLKVAVRLPKPELLG